METEKPCTVPAPGEQALKGQSLTVFISEDSSYRRLRRNIDIKSPSIPIQLTEKSVELRDGSSRFPISLPALQKSNEVSVPFLLTQDASGDIKSWALANFNGRKRLVVIDGALTLLEDYSTDLFTGAMCSGTCADVDGIIGYKEIILKCPGQPDVPAVQLIKLPGCCYGDAPEEE